jgi:hypothetical protein
VFIRIEVATGSGPHCIKKQGNTLLHSLVV